MDVTKASIEYASNVISDLNPAFVVLGILSTPIIVIVYLIFSYFLTKIYSDLLYKRINKRKLKPPFVSNNRKNPVSHELSITNNSSEELEVLCEGWVRITNNLNKDDVPSIFEKINFMVVKNFKQSKKPTLNSKINKNDTDNIHVEKKDNKGTTIIKSESYSSNLSNSKSINNFGNKLASYYRKITKSKNNNTNFTNDTIVDKEDNYNNDKVEHLTRSLEDKLNMSPLLKEEDIEDYDIDANTQFKSKKEPNNKSSIKSNSHHKFKTDNLQQFGWYYGVLKSDRKLYLYIDEQTKNLESYIELDMYEVSLTDKQNNKTIKDNLMYSLDTAIILISSNPKDVIVDYIKYHNDENTMKLKESKTKSNKLYVQAETPVEKEDWFLALCKSCNSIVAKNPLSSAIKKSNRDNIQIAEWAYVIPSLFETSKYENSLKKIITSETQHNINYGVELLNAIANRVIHGIMHHTILFYNIIEFIKLKLNKINCKIIQFEDINCNIGFDNVPLMISKSPVLEDIGENGYLKLRIPVCIGDLGFKVESKLKIFTLACFYFGFKIDVLSTNFDLILELRKENLNHLVVSVRNVVPSQSTEKPFSLVKKILKFINTNFKNNNQIFNFKAKFNIYYKYNTLFPEIVNYILSNVIVERFLQNIIIKLLPDEAMMYHKNMLDNIHLVGEIKENNTFIKHEVKGVDEELSTTRASRFSFLKNIKFKHIDNKNNTIAKNKIIENHETTIDLQNSKTTIENEDVVYDTNSEREQYVKESRNLSVTPPLTFTEQIIKRSNTKDKTPRNSLTNTTTFAKFADNASIIDELQENNVNKSIDTDHNKALIKSLKKYDNKQNLYSTKSHVNLKRYNKIETSSTRIERSLSYDEAAANDKKATSNSSVKSNNINKNSHKTVIDKLESEIKKKRPPSICLSTAEFNLDGK